MGGRHYIAEIRISPSVEVKIRTKHFITGERVRQALILRSEADTRWEHHPDHGRRLLCINPGADGRVVFAVLIPLDTPDGVWTLKTARFATNQG